MPYKPTGNPPGRPRKTAPVTAPVNPVVNVAAEPSKHLARAREGFRRGAVDPAAGLYQPPRFGKRRKEERNRRPVLHPNVIAGPK